MDDLTGTDLEHTQPASAVALWFDAEDSARAVLTGRVPLLEPWMQLQTNHGGVGSKTPEQWKRWGIKAEWQSN